MRLLGVDEADGVFHVAVYGDFFPDVDTAEALIANGASFSVHSAHIALTTRAFESTQVAAIARIPLTEDELAPLSAWRENAERKIYDRSVRLVLGVR